MNLPPYRLVTTPLEWQDCLVKLQKEPRLAIDLEANSMHAYQEQVCLIQISTPTQDYIIDPLGGLDLSGLGELVQDAAVEKVFHAAEYDLILLKRDFDWQLQNLFDTMWAARILGSSRYGLANILETRYSAQLNKKYQKANWCRRPLSQELLTYAQMDTHFLLRLREDLACELEAAGRTEEAQEIFAEQTHVRPSPNEFDPDNFWSMSGVHKLSQRQQAIAKALYVYRDQKARSFDRPHFKVFSDRTILELSQTAPRNLDELAGIHGMSKGQIRRHGRQILTTVDSALQAPLPKKPRSNHRRPSDEVSNRYEKLRTWRKKRARERGVESDVILSRESLWKLARSNPDSKSDLAQISSIGPWRRETYGDEILRILHSS